MRLNGREEIMVYLGRRWNPNNRRSWKKIRSKYLPALHYLAGSYFVWTTSEELDAIDRARSLTLDEVLAAKQAAREDCVKEMREGGGSKSGLLFLKLTREIYPGVKSKK
jgi:hypothetical protein